MRYNKLEYLSLSSSSFYKTVAYPSKAPEEINTPQGLSANSRLGRMRLKTKNALAYCTQDQNFVSFGSGRKDCAEQSSFENIQISFQFFPDKFSIHQNDQPAFL